MRTHSIDLERAFIPSKITKYVPHKNCVFDGIIDKIISKISVHPFSIEILGTVLIQY